MPGAGEALRGRTFGIPNVALLVAVAAGIWWFFLRGKGQAAGTTNAAAAGSQLQSGYGLGFAQGQQAAQATQPGATATATPTAPPVALWSFGPVPSNAPHVWRPTQAGQGAFQRATGGEISSAVRAGSPDADTSRTLGAFGWEWAIVPSGQSPEQYAAALNSSGGAVGGGAPIRKHAIGSRSAWLHHDAHPLIGAPVRYAHYVRVGGPKSAAAHRANINRVAQQAGVHPARVAMLNPVPTGLIRIA